MAKRKTQISIEGVTPVSSDEVQQEQRTDVEESPAPQKAEPTPQAQEPAPKKTPPAPKTSTARPARPAVAVDEAAAPQPTKTSAKKKVSAARASGSAQNAEDRPRAASSADLPAPLAWIDRVAPGHVNAVLGGLCGLIVALLVFVIGLWQTFFVSLLVAAGVAVGQCLDGDPKIVNALRDLFSDERSDEQG